MKAASAGMMVMGHNEAASKTPLPLYYLPAESKQHLLGVIWIDNEDMHAHDIVVGGMWAFEDCGISPPLIADRYMYRKSDSFETACS